MFDWIRKVVASRYVQGFARAIMAAFGGWLVSLGLDEETVSGFIGPATDLVVGLAVLGLTVASSWLDKSKTEEKRD